MRIPALFLALLTAAVFAAGCAGGPQDSDARLSEACDRQREEVAEEESGTPTAKSTEERLDQTTLIECTGQATKVVAADQADAKDDTANDKAEGQTSAGEDENKNQKPAGDKAATDGAPATTPVKLDPAARTLFAETCGSCHTLSDAETSGAVGPNLDDTKMDAAAVEQQIIEGGGAMPSGLLEGEEAKAVAEYVAGAAAAE